MFKHVASMRSLYGWISFHWSTLLLLFNRSVVSDSLRPHGLQHDRLPCPSPTPGACSNLCLLGRWCHPIISFSVIPFSCLQYFPASGSFPMSELFASRGQSIGVLASTSVLPMNIQDWFPLGLTGLISLQYKGTLKSLREGIIKKEIKDTGDWPTQISGGRTVLQRLLWGKRGVVRGSARRPVGLEYRERRRKEVRDKEN